MRRKWLLILLIPLAPILIIVALYIDHNTTLDKIPVKNEVDFYGKNRYYYGPLGIYESVSHGGFIFSYTTYEPIWVNPFTFHITDNALVMLDSETIYCADEYNQNIKINKETFKDLPSFGRSYYKNNNILYQGCNRVIYYDTNNKPHDYDLESLTWNIGCEIKKDKNGIYIGDKIVTSVNVDLNTFKIVKETGTSCFARDKNNFYDIDQPQLDEIRNYIEIHKPIDKENAPLNNGVFRDVKFGYLESVEINKDNSATVTFVSEKVFYGQEAEKEAIKDFGCDVNKPNTARCVNGKPIIGYTLRYAKIIGKQEKLIITPSTSIKLVLSSDDRSGIKIGTVNDLKQIADTGREMLKYNKYYTFQPRDFWVKTNGSVITQIEEENRPPPEFPKYN